MDTKSATPVFAYVTAQEKTVTNVTIGKELESIIALKCFPSYPRITWSEEHDYKGLRIFPAGASLCFSYFFNEGKRDRFRRPILSSKVMVIPKEDFNYLFRDLNANLSFLKDMDIRSVSEISLRKYLEEHSVTSSFTAFANFLKEKDVQFIAKSLGCLVNNSTVNIYFEEPQDVSSWMQAVFLFMPIDVMMKNTFVTDCEGLNQEYRENYAAVPKPAKAGLFQPISRVFDRDAQPFIDIAKKSVSGSKHEKLFEKTIAETTDTSPWYGIENQERNILLIDFLNKVIVEKKASLDEMSEKIRSMSTTYQKIRSLENLADN